MKRFVLSLIAVLAVAAVVVPVAYFYFSQEEAALRHTSFYFGVTCGEDTVEGMKLLIDRVQNFTNVFVVDSMAISENVTALNEVCNYASQKNLSFFVYFFSLYAYAWQPDWVVTANQTWGDNFLGVYLRDEPGGRQIDLKETVSMASLGETAFLEANYTTAAQKFVSDAGNRSMDFLKNQSIPVVVSDYALYWFDYEAGFDVVFAELGSNNSRGLQFAQCRGAAVNQGKEWGAIVTWTYSEPPYIENASKMYQDLIASYEAGANYCLVFDYPRSPETNAYGILTDDHFTQMHQFWAYTKTHPRSSSESHGEVAFVLPEDYGWGLRHCYDTIWGLWDPNNPALPYSPMQIGHGIYMLLEKYGNDFDVIYEQNGVNLAQTYSTVYLWNTTELGTPPPPITP